MHTVTALMGESNWTFIFKNPADADKLFNRLRSFTAEVGDTIDIEDDFGLRACLKTKIDAVQRSDVEKAFDGQGIMGLFQARAQGKLNAMAQRDPQLMFLNGPVAAPNGIIRPATS